MSGLLSVSIVKCCVVQYTSLSRIGLLFFPDIHPLPHQLVFNFESLSESLLLDQKDYADCDCVIFEQFQVSIVVISFLTNILVDTLGEDSNEGDLNPLFIELFTQSNGLFDFCKSFPLVRVFLAPPNIRLKPMWYSRLRPTIIRVLHRFLQARPSNLQILDDFAGDLEKDGVHYSILAGVNFVKSLADQALELVKAAPPDPAVRLAWVLFVLSFDFFGGK